MSLQLNGTIGVIGPVNEGSVIAVGSSASRNLEDRFADWINVKDFGAVGDGVADDTAAIQAAIDYAATQIVVSGAYPQVTSGIYISSGTYKIVSGSTLRLRAGVRISGDNRSSVRIVHGGGGVPCFDTDPTITGNTHIQINNISITGSGASTTHGIKINNNIRNGEIENVTISNCNINLGITDCWTIYINHCDFQDAIVNNISAENVTAATFSNCRIDQAGEDNVYLTRSILYQNVNPIFFNCAIQRAQKNGINAYNVTEFAITNCYFEANNRSSGSHSDIYWNSNTTVGNNLVVVGSFASVTGGGSNTRFITADVGGNISVIGCTMYDDLATITSVYEYGIYLGANIDKLTSINNRLAGTIDKIGRASTSTPIYDDSNYEFYLKNSKIISRETVGGDTETLIIADTNKDSSLIFGDTADNAQASISYEIANKRLMLSGYNNSPRCFVKENGQFQFAQRTTDPTLDVSAGDVYYNTTSNKLKVYNGTSWIDLH